MSEKLDLSYLKDVDCECLVILFDKEIKFEQILTNINITRKPTKEEVFQIIEALLNIKTID